MSFLSKLQNNSKNLYFLSGGSIFALGFAYLVFRDIQRFKQFKKFKSTNTENREKDDNSRVTLLFLKRLKALLCIIFPGVFTKETLLLFSHTLFLITRTFLSIYVAGVESKIVKAIVRRDSYVFLMQLIKFLLVALPATFVNSFIKFLETRLSLAFRTRLVKEFYRMYFNNQVYYRVESLDSRIKNVDQSLTDDISIFSNTLAHLYSQLTKPFLDLCLMNISLYKLAHSRGAQIRIPTLIAICAVSSTGEFLRLISPNFGTLIAEEARRKGNLRYVHSRIIQNSEEIAFYNGHEVESSVLWKAYQSLINQVRKISCQKLWYVTIEQFLMKYMWSASGLFMVSIPIVTTVARRKDGSYVDDDPDGGVSERTQAFTMARSLLINSAAALERMLSSYKEITELSGYTSRVFELLQVFTDLSHNRYKNVAIGGKEIVIETHDQSALIHTADFIELKNVPIITPNGDCVVPELTIRIDPGDHIFITGPNGCGKSSLFRVFHRLWPVTKGELHLPPPESMFYIPQKPYMFLGTFRDQIIYPHSVDDMNEKGICDADLAKILEIVQLEQILAREGGFGAEKDWINVLSGGEKQRVGMARLFYHKPKFALLDECTSAVSIDVESKVYNQLKEYGMTLLTITHRPTLRQFHKRILEFDGQGGWKLGVID